jgi:hypothetical protein
MRWRRGLVVSSQPATKEIVPNLARVYIGCYL